jgi:hypothetical protein
MLQWSVLDAIWKFIVKIYLVSCVNVAHQRLNTKGRPARLRIAESRTQGVGPKGDRVLSANTLYLE